MQTPRVYFIDPTGGNTKDPSVIRFGGKYLMYYSLQQETGWTIGIAESRNLLDWAHVKLLPPAGGGESVEAKGYCAPGARVLDGRVHLFYQSYGNGPRDAILHAVSSDGLHFERNKTNPIFRPEGDWTNGRAIDGEALAIGDKLMLYYATRDPAGGVQMVGVASAPLRSDFSRAQWTQETTRLEQVFRPTVPTPLDDQNLDLAWEQKCIEAATLMTRNGRHYMFYAGAYNNAPQQIGVAVSDDGIAFKRLSNGRPLLAPGPAGSWNASESGHPFVFHDDDGKDYLFFQGDNTQTGVKWHISMVPIQWNADPAGGPDVPMLDYDALKAMK